MGSGDPRRGHRRSQEPRDDNIMAILLDSRFRGNDEERNVRTIPHNNANHGMTTLREIFNLELGRNS